MTLRRSLCLVGALALLGAAVPATSSAAGDYHVWSCRDSAGNPLSTQAWVPFGNVANQLTRSDTCATPGGWLGVQMIDPPDYAGGSITGYALTAPAGTTIASYRVEMAGKTSSPTGGTHFELGLLLGGDPLVHDGDGCNDDLDPCTFGDLAAAWDAPANVFARSSLSLGGIVFGATCTAPSSCVVGSNSTPHPAFGRLYRSEVVLADPTAPIVGPIAGSVTAAGPVSGRRAVVADVSDIGGGVYRTQLLVDGVVVDQADGRGRCAEPFTAAAPCPDDQSAQFELDTTTLSDGAHQVVVRAFDAARNQADSALRTIQVDNRAAPSVVVTAPGPTTTPRAADSVAGTETTLTATNAADASAPSAVLRLQLARRAALPRAHRVRGTVVGADGRPRAGVRLRLDRRPFAGDASDWKTIATTTSAADGGFLVPAVSVPGEVRAVVVSPSATAAVATIAFVRPLALALKASDHTLRNGDTVALRGAVLHDGGAFAGRDALVQARVRGVWRTVDAAAVSAHGRIAWRYRFTNTRQTARYRFRLVLPKTKGLPWGRTVTDPVAVLVRGEAISR